MTFPDPGSASHGGLRELLESVPLPCFLLDTSRRVVASKGGSGRGIGTYGAKLLTEKYLHGRLWFTSEPLLGTRLVVQIPSLES